MSKNIFEMKIRDIITNNWSIIFFLFLLGIGYQPVKDIVKILFPNVASNSYAIIETIISDVIDKKIYPLQSSIAALEAKTSKLYEYEILILELGLRDVRTAKQADEIISGWEKNGWDAQIAAIKTIAQNSEARECLKGRLYNQEVFSAVMSRAR